MRRLMTTTSASVLVAGLLAWSAQRTYSQDPPAEAPPAPTAAYLGSKSCKKCHIREFKSWEETRMAKAYETLAPGAAVDKKKAAGLDPDVDYRTHPECLKCHVVGYGKQGGFRDGYDVAKDPERLLGIGCESCHGPGGAYVGDGKKDKDYKDHHAERLPALERAGYVGKPAAQACAECHKQESPTYQPFDWEKRQREGVHKKF